MQPSPPSRENDSPAGTSQESHGPSNSVRPAAALQDLLELQEIPDTRTSVFFPRNDWQIRQNLYEFLKKTNLTEMNYTTYDDLTLIYMETVRFSRTS